jgi:hypothetical protein
MAKTRKSREKTNTTKAAAIAEPHAAPVVTSASEQRVVAETRATHEQIARRAYELWLARGGIHGTHLEDWLAAERELHAA